MQGSERRTALLEGTEQGESGIVSLDQEVGCHHKGTWETLRDREGGRGLLTLPFSLQSMESQVEEWYREVGELLAQTAALPLEPASKELVGERQNAVGERLVRLLEPLQERRRLLLASKELHQVAHDLEDELVRICAGIWGGARMRGGACEDGAGSAGKGGGDWGGGGDMALKRVQRWRWRRDLSTNTPIDSVIRSLSFSFTRAYSFIHSFIHSHISLTL